MNPLKAVVAASLALALVVSSAWVQPEAQENLIRLRPTPMWAAKRSNIRMGPGTQHARVGLLEVGQKVFVTGQVGDWFRIRKGGGHAFVYGPLLSSTPLGSPSQQGKQVITYRSGRYEGQVRNGKEHGRGTFTWANGSRYEGDFVDGKQHGRGTYTWASGSRYEGDFVNGKRHGQGTYSWANGDRYEGEWRDGERTGRGTHVSASGKVREGEWRDGKLVRPTARMQRQAAAPRRQAKPLQQDRKLINYRNGDRYYGDLLNGKRHGRGIYLYANGDRYEGEWRDGERTGWGTHVSASGKVREGEWRDNKLVGPSARSQREGRRAQSAPARQRETRRQPQARWGAIVVYEDRNGRMSFGATWNNPNPNTAHQRALDKCNEERGDYCDEDGFRYLAAVFSTAASREDILSAYGPEPIFSFATSPAPGRVVTLRRRCVAFYDEKGGPPMMAFGNSEAEAKNRWSVFENDGSYTGAGTLQILCNDR